LVGLLVEGKDCKLCQYEERIPHCSKTRVTGLALGAVGDFEAQNCQYTTKVDAR